MSRQLEILPLGASSPQRMTVDIGEHLSILGDGDEQPDGSCAFRLLTPDDGDKRVVWNTFSLAEIGEAKEMFKQLQEQGMVAYAVGRDGNPTSNKIETFEPAAGDVFFRDKEIIVMPKRQIVGG